MNLSSTIVLSTALRVPGFAFVPGATMFELLDSAQLPDWSEFAQSWERLEIDEYMADQGRYRRRRHAVFHAEPEGSIAALPHQPHFQTLEYNPLHGDVQRWFAPIEALIVNSASLRRILQLSHDLFAAMHSERRQWRIEVHQFRIEATPDTIGLPTPEGVHRDGVDWVLVLMIQRRNIAAGVTTIHDLDRQQIGSFTLAQPFDAAWLDDHRCFHGVTAVRPLDPALPAQRDVLVVTFKELLPWRSPSKSREPSNKAHESGC